MDRHTAHISMSEANKYEYGSNLAFFLRKIRRNEATKSTNAQVEIPTLAFTPKVILGTSCFAPLNSACWDILGRLAAHQSCATGDVAQNWTIF